MTGLRRLLSGIVTGAIVIIAAVLIAHSGSTSATRHPGTRRPAPASAPTTSTPVSAGVLGGTVRQRLTVARVVRAFAASYMRYLDGARPSSAALRSASITARGQALAGGRIPSAFRDGSLRVTNVTASGLAASAQATVTAANRSESYVFSVQLLRTQFGWQVAQIETPDLSIDDDTVPVRSAPIASAAQRVAARFAVAYTSYRTHPGTQLPAGMTSTAQGELRTGQDPLAGASRSGGSVRLLGLRYGPLEGLEFAVTATVQSGLARHTFTVLMRRQPSGWECDAFL
jgi:hypothetical protein